MDKIKSSVNNNPNNNAMNMANNINNQNNIVVVDNKNKQANNNKSKPVKAVATVPLKNSGILKEIDTLLSSKPYLKDNVNKLANNHYNQIINNLKPTYNREINIDNCGSMLYDFASSTADPSKIDQVSTSNKELINLIVSTDDSNLFISDNDVLTKYKNKKIVSVNKKDAKKLYLGIENLNQKALIKAKVNFSEISVVDDLKADKIHAEINTLTSLVTNLRNKLNDLILKDPNCQNNKKNAKAKLQNYYDSIDNHVLLANDVLFNIEFDWYNTMFTKETSTFKRYYKQPTFKNPIVFNSLNPKESFSEQVNQYFQDLSLPLDSDTNIEKFFNAIKILIENNILDLTDITKNKQYLESFKVIVNYACNKLLSLIDKFSYTYEPLYIKTNADIKSFRNYVNAAKNEIGSVLKNLNSIQLIKSIDQFEVLNKFNMAINNVNNNIRLAVSLNPRISINFNDINLELTHYLLVVLNTVEFIRDIQIASKDSNPNTALLEIEKKHMYLFGLADVKARHYLDKSQLNNMFNAYKNLTEPLAFALASKFGIFYVNKTLNNIYVVLQACLDTYKTLANEVISSKESTSTLIHCVQECTSIIHSLKNTLEESNNYFDMKNLILLDNALKMATDLINRVKATKIETPSSHKLLDLFEIIKISIDKLFILGTISTKAWNNTYITKHLNGNVCCNMRDAWQSIQIPDVNEYLYSANYIKKEYCKICKTTHENLFLETTILTTYKDSTYFKNKIANKIIDLLNVNNFGDVDSVLTQGYITDRLSKIYLIEKGIVANIGKVLANFDAQITQKQLAFIFNDANNVLNNTPTLIHTKIIHLINDIILFSIKLWLLKSLVSHVSLLDLVRDKIVNLTPEYTSLILTNDYPEFFTNKIYQKVKSYRFSEEYNEDRFFAYFYCELTKLLKKEDESQLIQILPTPFIIQPFEQQAAQSQTEQVEQQSQPSSRVIIKEHHIEEKYQPTTQEQVVVSEPIIVHNKSVNVRYYENNVQYHTNDNVNVPQAIVNPTLPQDDIKPVVTSSPSSDYKVVYVDSEAPQVQQEYIEIEKDFVVSEFFTDQAPSEDLSYNNILKSVNVQYVPTIRTVNLDQFEKINEMNKLTVKQTFKDVLEKEKIKQIYSLSLDHFNVKDVWTVDEFITKK